MGQFNVNDGFLYVLVAVVIAFVIIESLIFLRKAWKQGLALGMDPKRLKKTVLTSILFTIAPAVAILLGVIALSKALGLPLPWLRLSVVGALTYELPAATSAAAAFGYSLSNPIENPVVFSAVAWVMTLGIIPGLILTPLFGEKIENGLIKIKNKDQRWGDLFMTSLFLGMISAFLGVVFAKVNQGLTGWIPVFVMLVSALLMLLCGLIRNLCKAKWIEDYALPISMLGAMALSIPITAWITSAA